MRAEPPVPLQPIDSASIAAIGYDPSAELLEVQFRSGRLYRYHAVSPAAWREFVAAPSKGQHFNRAIRDRFTFVRLE